MMNRFIKTIRRAGVTSALVITIGLATVVAAVPSFSARTDSAAMTKAAAAPELRELHKMPTFAPTILDKSPHNGFPAAAKLADGTLMVIYRLALYHYLTGGPNPTSMAKAYSFDGGQTWTAPEDYTVPGLAAAAATGVSVPQYGPLAGRPIAVFDTTVNGQRVTAVSVSNDYAGKAWSRPFIAKYNRWNNLGLASSAAEQISETEFATVGYATNGGTAVSVFNWTGSGFATSRYASIVGSEEDRFSEGTVAQIEDDKGNLGLIATLREEQSTTGGNLRINQSFSWDAGRTWSKPVPAFEGYGLPYVVSLGPNTVMVSYRQMSAKDSGEKTPPRHAVYRVSTDNGKTWGPEYVYGEVLRQMAYGVLIPFEANKVIGIYGKEDANRKSAIRSSTILLNLPNAEGSTYTLTATASCGGQVAPSGVTKVRAGETQSYKFTANPGYQLKQVLVNDQPTPAPNGALTLAKVAANATITASFVPNLTTGMPSGATDACGNPVLVPTPLTPPTPSANPTPTPPPAVIPSAAPTPPPPANPEPVKPEGPKISAEIKPSISATGTMITVTASGFLPGDQVSGVVHSTPRSLGTQTADAKGQVTFTFDAQVLENGDHSVILTGKSGGEGKIEFTLARDTASKPPVPANPNNGAISAPAVTQPLPVAPAPAAPAAKPESAPKAEMPKQPLPNIPVVPAKTGTAPAVKAPASPSAAPSAPAYQVARQAVPAAAEVVAPTPKVKAATPSLGVWVGYSILALGLAGAVVGLVMLLRGTALTKPE